MIREKIEKFWVKILIVLFVVIAGVFFYCFYSGESIRVFVTFYKPFDATYPRLIENRYMSPIQVGRTIENEPYMGGELSPDDIQWLHERMIGDDTGDNISLKNREFDVLTAYWWVWKHYKEIGNPKYIGFFAHRKWFSVKFNEKSYVGIMDEESAEVYLKILKEHKVIVNRWKTDDSFVKNYRVSHNVSDLNAMMEIIRCKYPKMTRAMFKVLYGQEPEPVSNFWIMEKKLAFDYFEKLFDVMFELEKEIGEDVKKRDLEQRRAYGYLAERFYAVWLEWQMLQNNIKPYFADVSVSNLLGENFLYLSYLQVN